MRETVRGLGHLLPFHAIAAKNEEIAAHERKKHPSPVDCWLTPPPPACCAATYLLLNQDRRQRFDSLASNASSGLGGGSSADRVWGNPRSRAGSQAAAATHFNGARRPLGPSCFYYGQVSVVGTIWRDERDDYSDGHFCVTSNIYIYIHIWVSRVVFTARGLYGTHACTDGRTDGRAQTSNVILYKPVLLRS